MASLSYELARALGITQKSAWFKLSRLRLALQSQHGGKMSGHVELDETFIGGKARNMHFAKRQRMDITQGRSMAGKVAVFRLLERQAKTDRRFVWRRFRATNGSFDAPRHVARRMRRDHPH
jgi:ISXO2-like transposase domain